MNTDRKLPLTALVCLAAASLSGCIVIGGTHDARSAAPLPQVATVAAADPAIPTASPGCILVVQGTVTDRANFFGRYVAALPPLYERYGGRYLAVGRPQETLEGELDFQSVVMSRWPSCDAARAFWTSPEYRELAQARQPWGTFDVFLIEASR
ncbi:MAG: DUF1330 domain-containing protein [Hyphomonadaceae bacterium]|jgi:uncharacterized protein (DUF1330 family)|nr:DUF1330 domain-containing protein [Hyphomonadaceae bacterium]